MTNATETINTTNVTNTNNTANTTNVMNAATTDTINATNTTNKTKAEHAAGKSALNKGLIVMTVIMIFMVLAYFVLIASISARKATVGDPILEMSEVLHVDKEEGLVTTPSDMKFVREFDIPEEGRYQFDIDYTVDTPGYYSAIVVKDSESEAAFSLGAFWITGYGGQVDLPKGKSRVEVHLITTEQELRACNEEFGMFDEDGMKWAISNLDFDNFQKDGNWDANLNMKVSPLGSGSSSSGTMIFLATAVLLSVLSSLCILIYRAYNQSSRNVTGTMSIIGSYYTFIALIIVGVQLAASQLGSMLIPGLDPDTNMNFQSLLIVLSVDLIGFPVLWLILKNIPAKKPADAKIGIGKWICYLLMSAGLCGIGAIIGSVVHTAVTLPFGGSNTTAIAQLMSDSNIWLRILAVGIGAPVFEELIFRKLLIDRVIKHGELLAILTSGLMFGLFHGNFSQFFYAFLLGCLFAYVYVRSGRIRYTILLHMAINMTSSVITSNLAAKYLSVLPANLSDSQAMTEALQNPETLTWVGLYLGWLGFLAVVAVIGVIVMIVWFAKKKFYLEKNEEGSFGNLLQLLVNPSMLLFYAAGIGLFILQYLPQILTFFSAS